MKKIYGYTVGIMLSGLLSLTGCGESETKNNNASAQASATDQVTYQVGMGSNYPPYEFIGEEGQPTGFEVELIQTIASDQNFKVSIVPMPWNLLTKGLDNKDYDIAIGGISRDYDLEEADKQKYLLSNPHIYGEDAIAVLSKNSTITPKTFEGLKGYRVSTLGDTEWVTDLEDMMGKNNDKVIAEKTSYLAFQKLIQGEADAMLNDRDVIRYYQKTIPEFPITIYAEGDYFEPYPLVMIANKDHQELMNKINTGLADIVKSGKYTQIYKKWFNEEPLKMPSV